MGWKSSITRRSWVSGATVGVAGLWSRPAPAAEEAKMKHVVLLGDSVFDNAAYVAGGPDVAPVA